MATCIPRVDGLSTDPRVWGVTGRLGHVGSGHPKIRAGRAKLPYKGKIFGERVELYRAGPKLGRSKFGPIFFRLIT